MAGGDNLIADYAGVCLDTSTAAVIDFQSVFEKIIIFDGNSPNGLSTSDQANNRITVGGTAIYMAGFSSSSSAGGGSEEMEIRIFEIASGVSGTAVTGITEANPGVITTQTVHGLSVNDWVKFTGETGMVELNDHAYQVNTTPTTSTLTLKNVAGVAIDTQGFTTANNDGNLYAATFTPVHSHKDFSVNTIGSWGSQFPLSLTEGNFIECYIHNDDAANNLTIDSIQMWINRIG